MNTINPTIADEMIDRAARASFAAGAESAAREYDLDHPVTWDGHLSDRDRNHWCLCARASLEATAPLIAAQALRDARDAVILELLGLLHAENDASALEMGPLEACGTVEEWLDARAAQVGGDDE